MFLNILRCIKCILYTKEFTQQIYHSDLLFREETVLSILRVLPWVGFELQRCYPTTPGTCAYLGNPGLVLISSHLPQVCNLLAANEGLAQEIYL